MANERPWTIKTKKKHFETASNNLITDLEFMRINAERDRIKKYLNITKTSANTYYKIIKRILEDSNNYIKEHNGQLKGETDPQVKIRLAMKEAKMKNLMGYITGKLFMLFLFLF